MRRDALLAAASGLLFAALTAGLAAGGWLLSLDIMVDQWATEHRPAGLAALARVINRLGQGGYLVAVCLPLAGWLGFLRRRRGQPWWPVLRPVALVVTTLVLVVPTVLLIKYPLTARGAPSSELPAEQVVPLHGALPPGEYAAGYPGGHVLNTVVWYGVLLVLVTALLRAYGRADPPWAVWLAVRLTPLVLVLWASTYLSFHWFTDGLAGLALGVAVDRVLALLRGVWAGGLI